MMNEQASLAQQHLVVLGGTRNDLLWHFSGPIMTV